MAKNTTAYFLNQQLITTTTITSVDGTGPVEILRAADNDSWVYEVLITSTNTSALEGKLIINDGTTAVIIKQLLSPNNILAEQGTGTTSANPLRLMQSSDGNQITFRLLDRDQNYYLPLPAGWSLYLRLDTAVDSGEEVLVTVFSRNFDE